MDPDTHEGRFTSPQARQVSRQICFNEQSQAKRLRGLETLIAFALDSVMTKHFDQEETFVRALQPELRELAKMQLSFVSPQLDGLVDDSYVYGFNVKRKDDPTMPPIAVFVGYRCFKDLHIQLSYIATAASQIGQNIHEAVLCLFISACKIILQTVNYEV